MNIDDIFFEKVVKETIEQLPVELREKFENLQIVVQEKPSADIENRFKKNILGLYHGVPWGKRGRGYRNVLPDTIIIYKEPLECRCKNKGELKNRIKEVVIHEIGHYFGFNDLELRCLEEKIDL